MGFWACQTEEPEQPLPDNEFLIGLMTDLHLAEMPLTRVPHDIRDSIGQILRARVAADYEMTPEEVNDLVVRIQLDLELNAQVYDSVVVRLERFHRTGKFENGVE